MDNRYWVMGKSTFGIPFWLVARLFSLNASFVVAAMLKLWVGGFSTFLLARQLGIGRRGAILAMMAFAFSGPMIVWLGSISGVAAWLPLLLYLSDRALARQVTRPFLLIGLVIACQFYSVASRDLIPYPVDLERLLPGSNSSEMRLEHSWPDQVAQQDDVGLCDWRDAIGGGVAAHHRGNPQQFCLDTASGQHSNCTIANRPVPVA